MLPHALRTGRGELHVVGLGPARVGVALDADRHGWPRFQYVADLVEQSEAARLNRRLVGVEEDLLFELDLLLGDDDVRVLLRASVVVGRPRIVRALVSLVGDAVLVVVRIGATVLVLEPVLVLRLVRALVVDVLDAVGVVVRIGATVLVLELVLVLRLVRALVGLVGDAVLVVVARCLGRAAQRHVVGLAGVAVGDADVIAGAEVV